MIWLIFAHFIGDWALQSDWVAQNKGKYPIVMIVHSMIWTACICIALEYLGLFVLWQVTFLSVGHYFCDLWKCKTAKKFPSWHLYVDQLFHIAQLIVVYKVMGCAV